MVSELGLTRGPGFEPPLFNLNPPFVYFKVHEGIFGFFYSLHAGMGLHVREGVE